MVTVALRDRASRWGRRVHKGTPFDVLVGIGLGTYGFVYLVVAAIAARIAVTGQRAADSPYAALDTMAETVAGEVLLWVTAGGLGVLTLWQVFETVWRRDPEENPLNAAFGRFGSLCSAAGYLTLGISATRVAVEGRSARLGRPRAQEVASSLEVGLLRAAVVVAGLVLVVLGVREIYRGTRRMFLDDLKVGVSRPVVVLGQLGHTGKGATWLIIAFLMLWSAVQDKLGPPGLQTVFRLVNLSPAGGWLVVLKALGFALFGIWCFAWAANRRR